MPPLPDPVVATGREGVLQVTAEWIEDFDEFQMWGEEYFDAGDRVVVRFVQRGRGAGSGALVQRDFWFMYEIGGGKVIRLDLYGERAQAFEAAGLASAADMDPGILRGRDEAD
ncbi:MAG: nuclear transport factor 2 family protein [Thermoleophilaceae bacterium]|nr:nuclear transport factor 2 family protein [Thermoleophilaceae bacterium]